MRDVTNMTPPRTGETAASSNVVAVGSALAVDSAEEQLAGLLIRMWSLASGRRLRPGARPDQLSPDELMNFWADDLAPACGRHARVPASAEAGSWPPWPPTRRS